MPSVLIIYDVEGWAYHHQAKALKRLAPLEFDVSLSNWPRGASCDSVFPEQAPELIFLMTYNRVELVRRAMASRGWTMPLVVYWSATPTTASSPTTSAMACASLSGWQTS